MPDAKRRQHYKRKLKELSALYEISQELDRSTDLQQVMVPVLQTLGETLGFERGVVTLFNRQAEQIQIDAAYGLTSEEQLRGRYLPGEGIVGQVIQTGQPAVVEDISRDTNFLNRTRRNEAQIKEGTSYICIPIKIESQSIGALSAERTLEPEIDLDEDVQLLTIIGSMIAQAVKVRRRVQEEKERLGRKTPVSRRN